MDDLPNKGEMLLVDTKETQLPDSSHMISPANEFPHGWILPHFNWVSPVNFFDGILHQYVEVIQRPSTKPFRLTLILDETTSTSPCTCTDVKNYGTKVQGHHWGMGVDVTETGVYTMSKAFRTLRDGTGLFTTSNMSNPPCFRFWLANQLEPGQNIPFDDKAYFPYKVRVIWVICAVGKAFSGWANYTHTH